MTGLTAEFRWRWRHVALEDGRLRWRLAVNMSSNDIRASFSQYNDQVEIAAPGVSVRSTLPTPVRHIDIAILLSMGVDESRGRDALKRVGSVEEAFLWLSKHDVSSCDTNGNGEDIASSCPAIQAQDDGKIIEQEQEHDAAKCTGPDSNSKMEPVDSTSHGKQIKAKEAHDLLIAELGNAIRACSKDLEIEWLGADLEKEWSIIEKYIS